MFNGNWSNCSKFYYRKPKEKNNLFYPLLSNINHCTLIWRKNICLFIYLYLSYPFLPLRGGLEERLPSTPWRLRHHPPASIYPTPSYLWEEGWKGDCHLVLMGCIAILQPLFILLLPTCERKIGRESPWDCIVIHQPLFIEQEGRGCFLRFILLAALPSSSL